MLDFAQRAAHILYAQHTQGAFYLRALNAHGHRLAHGRGQVAPLAGTIAEYIKRGGVLRPYYDAFGRFITLGDSEAPSVYVAFQLVFRTTLSARPSAPKVV